MASPKHKKSKMRKRQRVAQLEKAILASVQSCPVCGGMKQAHHVCPQCGTYNGRKVLSVSAK
ncbi:MAG: 50S ribosomal protein L32 [Lentisphaerae bacterium]|jgi:large subunit ribosomal protein L32|nr:50S ribosomal protein L32 [Lentisphaerota bacterium]